MKPGTLNKLHRYAGVGVAPFLVIQTLSGLLLDFGLFRRGTPDGTPPVPLPWEPLLTKIHFGPGLLSDAYHLLLGTGIVWMAVSGWLLYLRLRRARRRSAVAATRGESP